MIAPWRVTIRWATMPTPLKGKDMDTDARLLQAYARTRDPDSFRELVRRYGGYVYGVALRVTGNRDDAEDVTQECFLSLARAAGKVTASPAGWLHTVAVRRAANVVRNAATRKRHERSAPPGRTAGHETEAREPSVTGGLDRTGALRVLGAMAVPAIQLACHRVQDSVPRG